MRNLPDWIDGYQEYNKENEAPDKFLQWVAVGTIAAALQRKVKLHWGQLLFYPNFYIILVSEPGQARKGEALKPSKRMLRDINITMSADSVTREQLIRSMEDCTDTVTDIKKATTEAHCSLTVFSPEFTVFLGYNNLALMADLTDWFDCADEWAYETKNMGKNRLHGIFMNILGATTPGLLQTTLPIDAVGGGLTSRMIFVYERGRRFKHPFPFFPMEPEGMKLYEELVQDLEDIRLMQGKFKVTRNFKQNYMDWYMSMPEEPAFDPQRFAGYWSRRATHLFKLCMIMNVSRGNSMQINTADLNRALTLLEETETKMPLAFSGVGKHKQADMIEPVIREIMKRKETSVNELLGIFIRDLDSMELDRLLTAMEKVGWIKKKHTSSAVMIQYIGRKNG